VPEASLKVVTAPGLEPLYTTSATIWKTAALFGIEMVCGNVAPFTPFP